MPRGRRLSASPGPDAPPLAPTRRPAGGKRVCYARRQRQDDIQRERPAGSSASALSGSGWPMNRLPGGGRAGGPHQSPLRPLVHLAGAGECFADLYQSGGPGAGLIAAQFRARPRFQAELRAGPSLGGVQPESAASPAPLFGDGPKARPASSLRTFVPGAATYWALLAAHLAAKRTAPASG